MKEIKSSLLAAVPEGHQQKCPYCRLDRELSQFDHVVEKARLPELAFFHRNLVPSCDTCNNRRLGTFDETGQQQVLHLYDDAIDSIPDVLRVNLSPEGRSITAYFELIHPLPQTALLYAKHFTSLGLAERYQRWAAAKMNDLRDELHILGPDSSCSFLQQFASRLATRLGNNEPVVALYRALWSRPDIVRMLVML